MERATDIMMREIQKAVDSGEFASFGEAYPHVMSRFKNTAERVKTEGMTPITKSVPEPLATPSSSILRIQKMIAEEKDLMPSLSHQEVVNRVLDSEEGKRIERAHYTANPQLGWRG